MNDTYENIKAVCLEELQRTTATDPDLFDRIVSRLSAAGVSIDQAATEKVRTEDPNVVAVFNGMEEQCHIDILGEHVDVYAYDGERLGELITAQEALLHYEDTPITQEDLTAMRHIERDGEKFYDAGDVEFHSVKKAAERRARRESQRNLTLVLPDEFLQLCEEVNQTPATILQGFIADLCDLKKSPYITNGSDERLLAEKYFERCGYRYEGE